MDISVGTQNSPAATHAMLVLTKQNFFQRRKSDIKGQRIYAPLLPVYLSATTVAEDAKLHLQLCSV